MTSRRALADHMPELVPTWERLTDLAGGGDRAARLLSLYRPTPYLVACSQVIWTRAEPWLIRNYDYHPAQCEGTILLSCWRGTRVIASTDSLWGVLDGMNEHGLAVTLAFGGRPAVGTGFAITLILRYVLEVCRTVDDAVAVLRRVPSHMVYTVGLVDRSARHATVYVAPDRPTEVSDTHVSTNHQRRGEWSEYHPTHPQRGPRNRSRGSARRPRHDPRTSPGSLWTASGGQRRLGARVRHALHGRIPAAGRQGPLPMAVGLLGFCRSTTSSKPARSSGTAWPNRHVPAQTKVPV